MPVDLSEICFCGHEKEVHMVIDDLCFCQGDAGRCSCWEWTPLTEGLD